MKKNHHFVSHKRGFTLVELLVAMVIAIIIMGLLVGVTNVAMGAWTRGRAEVRAARQAKTMLEAMAKDLETFVIRSGNNFEWLYAKTEPQLPGNGNAISSNACELICFSAATDRYRGGAGTANDLGGDICTASYKLAYQDPIAGQQNKDSTFVFYRQLLDPRPTFNSVLGQTDLRQAFTSAAGSNRFESTNTVNQTASIYNFVCENIYQYSITFRVDVSRISANQNTTIVPVRVTLGQNGQATEFRVYGNRIVTDAPTGNLGVSSDELAAGRLSGVEVSLTVISDKGLEQLKTRTFKSDQERAAFLAKNTFQYSKLIDVPGT